VDLDEYQQQALTTDVLPRTGDIDANDLHLPLMGLVGEVGGIAAEVKKRARDAVGYVGFREELREELGDALWYLAVVAERAGLSLADVAEANLTKTRATFAPFDPAARALYDGDEPEAARLPRRMRLAFAETTVDVVDGPVPTVSVQLLGEGGGPFGNRVDDNSQLEDDYRFHDALHLAHVAVLGWSPVVRAILPSKPKRRGSHKDRTEDGARAIAVEEGLVAAVFSEARAHDYFSSAERIPSEVLKLCRRMTSGLEVSNRSPAEWEQAILVGYRAFNRLRAVGGGIVAVDVGAGTLQVEA
jgi:NTP pyrophosphatase (non-canonical NTP hydrolase)